MTWALCHIAWSSFFHWDMLAALPQDHPLEARVFCKTPSWAGRGLWRTGLWGSHCFFLSVLTLPHHEASAKLNGQAPNLSSRQHRGQEADREAALLHTIQDSPVPSAQNTGPHGPALSLPSYCISWQASLLGLLVKITCSVCSYRFNIFW